MRLFIGIYPSTEYLEYFRDVFRVFDKQKRNLKPINLEQIHLTLRFIGANVSLGSKNQIAKELVRQSGSYPRPNIHIDRLQFGFPRQHDPRVLLASIGVNHELEDLVDRLHKTVRAQKRSDTILWKSDLDNNFHMSLARLKPAATRSTGREVFEILHGINLPTPPDFQATEMYLVDSTLTRKGPVYKKLEQIKL